MTSTTYLLTADQLLAAPGLEPAIEGGAVLVDGDRIRWAGPVDELPGPLAEGAARVDFGDATILPGLIDGHVHLAFTPDVHPTESIPGTPEDALLDTMADHARQMLARGVTTVRDLGDRDHLGARLSAERGGGGAQLLPRVLAAGPPLTPPGGHCWFLGGEVESDAGALERAVAQRAARSTQWIKVMVSGGAVTEGGAELWESQYDEEQLRVIVCAAAQHGLPVAAHAHGAEAIRAAANAGVRTIEHCSMVNSTGTGLDLDPTVADLIVRSGAWASHADSQDRDRYARAAGEKLADQLVTRTRWLADQGVPLFAGTDAGVAGFDQLVATLERQSEHFSATELLRTATVNAARALRLDHETGRVAADLAADILVVDGDPTTAVTDLAQVRAVFARGRRVGDDGG